MTWRLALTSRDKQQELINTMQGSIDIITEITILNKLINTIQITPDGWVEITII